MSWETQAPINYNFTCDWCKGWWRCTDINVVRDLANWRSVGPNAHHRHLCKDCQSKDPKVGTDFLAGKWS